MNQKIIDKVDKRVEEFLDMDPMEKGFNPGLFDYKMKQAVVGMRFKQNSEMMERIGSGQIIRVIAMVSEDKEQREAWVRQSMPKILPVAMKKTG